MINFKKYLRQSPNFLAIFIFAVFMLAHTSILLEIGQSVGALPQHINYVFAFFTVGSIGGRLTAFMYNIRFNSRQIMVGCLVLLAGLALSMWWCSSLIMLYLIFTCSGYLLGIVYIQANKNLMESDIKNKGRLANIGLSFYPLGASLAPLAASLLVRHGFNWQLIYILTIPLIVSTIILFMCLSPASARPQLEPKDQMPLKELFGDRKHNLAYTLIVLMVLTYCISEAIVFTWMPTFLRAERGFSLQSAGAVVTIFWWSVIGGRMIVGLITSRIKTFKIMLSISILGAISVVFMALSTPAYLVYTFTALAGLGYSGLFPLMVSSGTQIFKQSRGIIITIIFAASSLGKAITPYIIDLSSKLSLFFSVIMAAVFMALTVILLIIFSQSRASFIFMYRK